MRTIRLHFTYKHVDRPWGGANNFIRAVRNQLATDSAFQFTSRIEEPCDVLFMNQLAPGPGATLPAPSVREVRQLLRDGRRLAVRAVNLNRHAFRLGLRNLLLGWWRDLQTLALLDLAHVTIFQSVYQRAVFAQAGYRGARSAIIHNGADPAFWNEKPPRNPKESVLRIVSSTASERATKRHDLIAAVSRVPGVEVIHCGRWPRRLNPGKVQVLGVVEREKLAAVLADSHLFLHPAIKDPCPNSIFEAICCGLPVIYHPGPGSSAEIVGPNGIALDEARPRDTIERARQRLPELQAIVRDNRTYYRVERASAAYSELFRQLATT